MEHPIAIRGWDMAPETLRQQNPGLIVARVPLGSFGGGWINSCFWGFPCGYLTSPWKITILIGKPSINGPWLPWLCEK